MAINVYENVNFLFPDTVDEANRTPSPIELNTQGELLIEKTMEGSTEQVQELQPLQPQKEQQTSSSEDSEQKDKPPMSANPAKRILSNSDDSDAGNDKPDMQRLKSEHGAVTRTKTTRSNRWGATQESSGKEDSQTSSTVVAIGMAKELAVEQQQATPRRGVSNNLRGTHDPVLGFGGKVLSQESIRKDIFRSADSLRLPKGQESLVFHRKNFVDQNAVIRSASAYADFIIEDACGRGISEEERRISRDRDGRNAEGIPDNEIKRSVSGHLVVNASYEHVRRQSDEDLKEIQGELEAVMVNLQGDPTRMTQFRGWSSRNVERSKKARERCFHWSAPGTPQLPRLPYTDKLHKLSVRLEKFLLIGGRLHDDCVGRSYIPPAFAYQIWLDKVTAYRAFRALQLKTRASEAPVQLLRRVPHITPSTVGSTVKVKSESATTGGRGVAMLLGTPEGKMGDLRKQKDAVMYLSGEYDEDDMSYYAALFKRTMESDIAMAASAARQVDELKIVTEQEIEEARQAWLARKHDCINEQLRQLKNSKQQDGHGPISGQGGV